MYLLLPVTQEKTDVAAGIHGANENVEENFHLFFNKDCKFFTLRYIYIYAAVFVQDFMTNNVAFQWWIQ